MPKAETSYAQLDREAMAAMFVVERFPLCLFGHHFEIQTDYKPLLGLIGENKAIQ